MSTLPKTGLQAVIEGATKFVKDLDAVNKAIDDNAKKTKEAGKSATPLDKTLGKMGVSFDSLKDKVSQFAGVNSKALDGIIELASAFGPLGVAIGGAVVGIVALGAGFLALGQRGAPLVGLARAFDNLAASVGLTSQSLLSDLRKASAGTISDFQLIETANAALSGATGKLGQELGKNLPRLMEIARNQAKVTGKSVDFLFNSIVEGIRKSSPLRIDNASLIIKTGKAEQAYAESVGKTVEQLTVEEKGIAVLNATLEAGNAALEQSGNLQETNAEKLSRVNATITNIFDALAVAVQPAFGAVLDIVNRVLGGFQALATGIAPIIGSIASIISEVLGGAFNTILDIIQPVVEAISSFLPYIAILFQGIANVVGGVVNVIRSVVGGIVNFLKDVAQRFFGLDLSNLGKNLFEGAAAAFGSFANGIIAVANQLIFPAVIGIAKFIADFLIGFSPPKKGPLSNIDKGGYNVMAAWLEGFTGVSLDPVDQVAAEVNAALGDIGKASLKVVNARLAQLDAALKPFQNRLDIVKAQFEALAEPAKQALDAIDRQVQEAQAALMGGDQAAAERIRQLDAAREAIQGQLDVQQALVDRQQIQLALATAAQAQERALLNIRKANLDAVQKTTKASQTAAGSAPKEDRVKGGAGPAPMTPGENTGIVGLPSGPSALDLIGGQSAVNDAIAGIQDAFAGQIDTSQLALFQQNQGDLQTQLDRIGSVDLGKKLGDKFKGLTDLFDPANPNSIPAKIGSAIGTLTADENTNGSIAHFFASVGPNVQNALSTLGADASTEGSVAYLFAQLGPGIEAAKPGIEAAIRNIFDSKVDGSPAQILTDAVMALTGDQKVTDSVASFFAQMPTNISDAAKGLFDQLKTNVFDPVSLFLTGEGPDTLSGIIDGAVNFFAELPGRIVEALKSIGVVLYNALALPVITVINSLIGLVEGGIKGFLQGVIDFLKPIADALGDFAPQFLKDALVSLRATQASVSFGRISTEIPAFLQPAAPPGAASGGLFSGGLLRVGERGPETLFNASKVGILPADLTRIMQGIGSIMAQPAPMMLPQGDTYNSSSSTFNFNGVQSDNDARRRYNALRAGMR